MILLDGHSLTPKKKVPLESMNLELTERDSTATIVPADMDGITIDSWMLDDTEPGKGIVWRVKGISEAFHSDTVTVQLEHIVSGLRDRILFGEVKADTITGKKKATTCTAKQAVQYILKQHEDWTLGEFGFNVTNPYKFDGDTLIEALQIVSDSLPDAVWTYDMSRYPFRLNITQASDTVASEMRASRNMRTITRSVDKSGMYTRFYPIGKDDLHLDEEYVDRNTETYGIICKTDTDQTIETQEELRRWAEERLKVHAEPTMTIDVEGFELAEATGEPLDKLTLCRVCRVPLPEYDTMIQERIKKLSYADKIRQPKNVKIRMENNRQDLVAIVADMIRRGGGGGRAAARKDKEDHAWFEDTNDHVAMCAEGIVGTDAAGNPNWVRLSQIIVDGEGIHQTVESVQNGLVIASSRIDQTEYEIKAEVKRASKEEGNLTSRIKQTADEISAEVTRAKAAEGTMSSRITQTADAITAEVTRATEKEGTLTSQISQQADKISLVVTGDGENAKVNTAEIVAGINGQTGSYVKIAADTINLSGYVTATSLNAVDAKIDNLTSGATTATSLKTNLLSASTGFTYQNHSVSYHTVTVDGTTYHLLGY